ncbi:hypothetical protein PTT_14963 [Pyrenophora teres f. teres 0-1]|uniref:Uncharacterized protein n=1 Tax=Pyrenophora teres f. teres (strain 0-1) TaxID=861557 RepID=E3RZB0_PYRTT|nr:hypothetical protein PTT_14963 [Pyrenophora teres f. teres 0-1]
MKRKRPTTVEFRQVAAELDYINSLSTESKIPAIIDLISDSEFEAEIHNNESTTQRDLARRRKLQHLGKETPQLMREKAQRKKNALKRRRLIVDSEDESDDESTPPSLSSSASIPPRSLRDHRQVARRRRKEGWVLSDTEEDIVRKPEKRKMDLKAEIEDLEIDMEGWGEIVRLDE